MTTKTTSFSGVLTALVTPMNNGEVSLDDLAKLVEYQIDQGIDGVVPAGTTGESPTLSHREHGEVIRCVVETAAGRVPVVAGAGSNATSEAVSLTRKAHEAGVDGMLQVTPYYNKPTQEGLFEHFSAVAEVTDKPIVLYSIPGRCVVDIGVDTVVRLRTKYPHINAIKEAGGDCDRVAELRLALGDDLTILSGDDSLTLPFMASGAKGVISVVSNLVVKEMVALTRAALENDLESARDLHLKLYPLAKILFCEPNPVPVKAAMHRAGIIGSPEVRLPLTPLTAPNRERLFEILDTLGY